MVGLCAVASAAQEPGETQTIPLLPSASDGLGRVGIVRVVNHSDKAGEVHIDAIDDEGQSHGPVVLPVDAGEALQFNSDDLENGDAERRLSDGVGPGEGAWRLELSSALDFEVLSYVRSADGVFSAMHDSAPSEGGRHRIAFFNPGSNTGHVSRLRLVNPGTEAAEVSITGVDARGESPGSEVTTTLPTGAARTFTMSATVRNDGDAPSPAAVLRYFRSTDRPISATDRLVGTAAVPRLAASGSVNALVELTAPSILGPYYYGACVGAVAGESDTANNCSSSPVRLDVI